MTVTHNSKLCHYRHPLGALRTTESALLRVVVKPEETETITAVKIKIFIADVGTEYDMLPVDSGWQYTFTAPETPCVAWYFFCIQTAQGCKYYGPPAGRTQGEGLLYDEPCPSFQLTVYDRAFRTPDWFHGTTMYQIFPDRFRRGDPQNLEQGKAYHERMGRKIITHESWEELPLYQPVDGEKYYSPCDFFGGDLRGIIDSLDEIASLGVGVIYLNPIVESASNHRYDTADYMRVDPILGSNADFTELCREAEKRGIHVMFDGVYSHTGSDSRYFNKLGNYAKPGAFQGTKSPYYNWYTFYSTVYNYKCWWGFDTLPEVNELDKNWQRYVITGHHSVFRNWMGLGAKGIRLDVADELPDEVIELMRTHLKRIGQDNVLLGEVWEDATTKRSYGKERHYALGKGLDSVMNYPFKNACTAFLQGEIDAYGLEDFLSSQELNYPKPMYYSLMNLLSSHDVPRIRTVLSTGLTGEGMSREEQAALNVSQEQDQKGAALQRLAAVLQFTVPGVPTIYYGDEYGLHGLKDPFNRGTFVPRDPETYQFYQSLAELRKNEPVLQTGFACFLALNANVIALLRLVLGGTDAFGKTADDCVLLSVVNRSEETFSDTVDLSKFCEGLPGELLTLWQNLPLVAAENLRTGDVVPVPARRFSIDIEPRSWSAWKLR